MPPLSFCDILQHALVILQFLTEVSKCKSPDNPFISSLRCQNSISSELHLEFNEMINIMKKSIDPQIFKEVQILTQQPKYNYVNFFKYDVEFVARFVLDRIEKAFDEINYDHFFTSKINNCAICDHQNQTTSRTCLKDKNFKEKFIKTSIKLFSDYPIEIEKRKFEVIDQFKKKNDINLFLNLFQSFSKMFDETKRVELEMQNMIKDRFIDCCTKRSRTELNSKSSKFH